MSMGLLDGSRKLRKSLKLGCIGNIVPTPEALPPLPVLLLRARRVVASKFNEALRQHNLTEAQWRVISSLARSDGVDLATIANRIDLLGPSVSRILRDLEGRGLVRRTPGNVDARHTLTYITDSGRGLVAAALKDMNPVSDEMGLAIGQAEMRDLQNKLLHIIKILSE